ncbi:MAG: hypothetical protein N2512_05995 [Armatimonadetes bacterium]|nr:hypothetical protein [Armatimonadota bacterium]
MKLEKGRNRFNSAYGGAGWGFTLVELLTVIAIAVILMVLVFPVGKSLRDGNRMMACASALHAIHQALKMYWLDERAVPPPYDPTPDPNNPNPSRDSYGGLYRLYTSGYLNKEVTLHCPAHVRDLETMMPVKSKDVRYYHSYDSLDPDAKAHNGNPVGVLAKFTYMPYRGAGPGDPDYHRQLASPDPSDATQPLYLPTWKIDDTAVVCWCPHHAKSVKRKGEPAYHVLFWGGEVLVKGESVMHDAGVAPTETWRVRPED